MPFTDPPRSAAWRHQGARSGFEVVYFEADGEGLLIDGCTTAVEGGRSWVVDYEIRVDGAWKTRRARVTGRSSAGSRTVTLSTDGNGHWGVDGKPLPHLDGCLDVDLESSAVTNTLPVHRLALGRGEQATAPAAFVRALDLSVERLEQRYLRTSGEDSQQRYDYAAPAFDFSCELAYDGAGLVLAYPGIAVRAC